MKIFQTSVRIAASPERVWEVLADVVRWPEWTASVTEARFAQGASLHTGAVVALRQPKLAPALWTVTSVAPVREFIWEAQRFGLAIHAVRTVMQDPGGCNVTLHLTYSGLFGPLASWLAGDLTRRYMALEAEGLKRRAEGSS